MTPAELAEALRMKALEEVKESSAESITGILVAASVSYELQAIRLELRRIASYFAQFNVGGPVPPAPGLPE